MPQSDNPEELKSWRLNKYLVICGVADSRRKADELILKGGIEINGSRGIEISTQVSEGDKVVYKGHLLRPPKETRSIVIALNKPKGYVCSHTRDEDEKLVFDLLPNWPFKPIIAGRLDKESEGLLILTNNGDVANIIMHPSEKSLKIYHVVANMSEKLIHKPDSIEFVRKSVEKGVKLGDGMAKGTILTIKKIEEKKLDITISVQEGRKHLIRRMMAATGLDVKILERTQIGKLTLESLHLKLGKQLTLTKREIELLLNSDEV